MKNIAIFASGSGSNAMKIIHYFQQKHTAQVKFIITNNLTAGVINKAKNLGVSSFYFTKDELNDTENLLDFFQQNYIEFIVLAGYLRKIPTALVNAFPDAIVNIHPALLPDFGGKGMHGHFVHEAVIKAGKLESGITIHLVNEHYDDGQIVYQERCEVKPDDSAESLAQRVLELEHKNYPRVIEELLMKA